MKKFILSILVLAIVVLTIMFVCESTTIDATDVVTPTTPTLDACVPSTPSDMIPPIDMDESLVEEPETTIEPTEPEEVITPMYYTITEEERELLARLCFLESSICSSECQRAVVSVVFNRLESGKWKIDMNNDGIISLYDIIYYPNAFSPADKIDSTTADEASYEAVDYVIQNGPTVPTYVRYFRTKYHFNWDGYKGYCVMDNVYFGYMEAWQNGAW